MTYTVKVYCCTHGNCGSCHGGFDVRRRKATTLLLTEDKAAAERVQRNWYAYDAFIEESPS